MNKTAGFTVAVAAGLVLALAGCGPHSGKVKADLASASANPAAAAAKAKVEGCVTKDLTQGTQAVVNCIVPPNAKAGVETCVTGALTKDGLLTKAARGKFYEDAANCGVTNG